MEDSSSDAARWWTGWYMWVKDNKQTLMDSTRIINKLPPLCKQQKSLEGAFELAKTVEEGQKVIDDLLARITIDFEVILLSSVFSDSILDLLLSCLAGPWLSPPQPRQRIFGAQDLAHICRVPAVGGENDQGFCAAATRWIAWRQVQHWKQKRTAGHEEKNDHKTLQFLWSLQAWGRGGSHPNKGEPLFDNIFDLEGVETVFLS